MPVFLFEDETEKFGKRHFIVPPELDAVLQQNKNIYSGDEYKNMDGYKRLCALVDDTYNDPKNNKGKISANQRTITFPMAKRMDFDIRHMNQSKDNLEYQMIGGDAMRNWLHSQLSSLRNSVKQVKPVPQTAKIDTKTLQINKNVKPVKLNGIEVKLESKDFETKISKIFE